MSFTPDDVVAAIPGWTAAGRARVLAALLASKGERVANGRASEAVYAALADVLKAKGIAVWSLGTYQRHKTFGKNAEAITAFVKEWIRPADQGVERKALKILIELVAKDLVKRGKVCDQAEIVWNLGRACPLLDAAFPGYREGGNLPMVLRNWK